MAWAAEITSKLADLRSRIMEELKPERLERKISFWVNAAWYVAFFPFIMMMIDLMCMLGTRSPNGTTGVFIVSFFASIAGVILGVSTLIASWRYKQFCIFWPSVIAILLNAALGYLSFGLAIGSGIRC